MANETPKTNGGPGAGKDKGNEGKGQSMNDGARTWMMVILTAVFVLLYIGALFGFVPGGATQDQQTLTRIEAIVFVIIGYYFGRRPAQATEKTLKGEIERQTQKADQAEKEKDTAEGDKRTLQEKVKNARAALGSTVPDAPPVGLAANLSKTMPPPDALRQSVLAAVNVLES
jgi:hypothetical protein